MRLISKSILIMFIFDMFTLLVSTTLWYTYFELPIDFLDITVLLTVLSGLAVLFLKDNYKIREFNVTLKNYYLLFEGIVFSQIPAAALLLTFIQSPITFEYILANLLTIFVVLRLYRVLFHYYLFNIKRTKNVLILGAGKNAKLIADEILNKKALKMNVVGLIEDSEDEQDFIPSSNLRILSRPKNLKEIIKNNKVDIFIIGVKRRMEESLLTEMIEDIPKNVKVYKMPDFYEMVTGKYFIDRMSINWLFYDFMNRRSIIYDFCKRIYDIVSSIIILTLTFPVLLYIGIRVKLTDGGPAIYTQNRIGKNGNKPFKMYKLRTMYKNDYVPKLGRIEHTEPQENDDRVIPFCKFVRKARFDEIPQMINILRGEMSIVGPRSEWEDLVKIYSSEIPYYMCRQWVKTGWTGWAQINQGHCVSNDDVAEKLQYDLYYLKHKNIFWEISILVKAVFLALGGRHG